MGEKTDRRALGRDLNACLPLQSRAAVAFALAAGTLPGPAGIALGPHLRRAAAAHLRDVEALAARVASLGADPAGAVTSLKAPEPMEWRATVEWLAKLQGELLDALVKAIPADADDAEGEATEHLLEHVITRQRNVLEMLQRALR